MSVDAATSLGAIKESSEFVNVTLDTVFDSPGMLIWLGYRWDSGVERLLGFLLDFLGDFVGEGTCLPDMARLYACMTSLLSLK